MRLVMKCLEKRTPNLSICFNFQAHSMIQGLSILILEIDDKFTNTAHLQIKTISFPHCWFIRVQCAWEFLECLDLQMGWIDNT